MDRLLVPDRDHQVKLTVIKRKQQHITGPDCARRPHEA
jgi:4'-phosphopantetheinyl transferase EntD